MRSHLRLIAAAGAAALALLPVVGAASPAEAALLPTDEHISSSFTPGGPLEAGVSATVNIAISEKTGGDPGGLQGRVDITITTPAGSQHHARQVHAMNAAWSYPLDTSVAGSVHIEADFVPASGYENEVPEGLSEGATIAARPTLSTTSNVIAAGGAVTVVVSDPDGMAGAAGTVDGATGGLNLGSCAPTVGSSQTAATCSLDVSFATAPGIYSVPFTYTQSTRYQTFSTTIALQITAAASSGGSSASASTGSGSSGGSSSGGGSSGGGSSGGGSSGGGGSQGGTGAVALPGASVSATPGTTASALPAGVIPSPTSTVLFAKQASAAGPIAPVVAVIGVVVLVAVVVLVLLIVLVVRAARRA